jgi:hypothetical protein
MKLSRTVWISAAATTAIAAAVVTGISAASADQHPARTAVVAPATSVQPAGTAAQGLGAMIHTNLDATPVSEWVIKAKKVKVAGSKQKILGFGIYDRANNGRLTEYLEISDLSAATSLKAGFHATEHAYTYIEGMEVPVVQPAFGYFVGTPAKITGTVDGRTVTAERARWSADPKVTVFWFDNTRVTGDTHLTSVSAYDAAGKRLAKAHVYTEGEGE